jgi:hypothetical protein
VRTIGNAAFSGCIGLTNVTIGNGVRSIRDDSFRGCIGLTSVVIPNSVVEVSSALFADCSGLTNVSIGAGATTIHSSAFGNCPRLKAVDVAPLNPAYSSVGGVLFNKALSVLFFCPVGKTESYFVPSSVTKIWDFAFVGSRLTSLYFEGNAPTLDFSAFFGADFVTIFYRPGTAGWGPTYDGRPTALWLPLVQTGDASFGVRTNQFGFNINWASGQTVVVQAATNLSNPIWVPVATNALTSGTSYFSDPLWTNHPQRFYRLTAP